MKFIEQGPESGSIVSGALSAGYAREGAQFRWYVVFKGKMVTRGHAATLDLAKSAIVRGIRDRDGRRKSKKKSRPGNKETPPRKPGTAYVNLDKGQGRKAKDKAKGKGKGTGRTIADRLK